MKKQILLVDDDAAYANVVHRVLMKSGYDVETVYQPTQGLQLLKLKKFDLILSDFKMPKMNGLQFFEEIRKTDSSVPFVIMTGFANEHQPESVIQTGASGFLAKPFNSESMLKLFKAILFDESDQEAFEAPEVEFRELGIDEFISGKIGNFNIFVRLESGRFLKVVHSGEELTPGRLLAYKKRGLTSLYLKLEDYQKYVDMQLKLAQAVTQSQVVSREKRVAFVRRSNEFVLHQIFSFGVDEHLFQHVKNLMELNIKTLAQSDELLNLIGSLNSISDQMISHSMGVSIYSTLLAKALGWDSQDALFNIYVGALFHDMGLRTMPLSMTQKPYVDYTAEELKEYQRHPLIALDMLKGFPDITTEVLLIIAQHHESPTGNGFPAGLSDALIFPMAKVVAIADEFCELVIKSPGSASHGVLRSHVDALKFLTQIKGSFLDQKMLEVFLGLFSSTKKGAA